MATGKNSLSLSLDNQFSLAPVSYPGDMDSNRCYSYTFAEMFIIFLKSRYRVDNEKN